jgi:hypothetical protein
MAWRSTPGDATERPQRSRGGAEKPRAHVSGEAEAEGGLSRAAARLVFGSGSGISSTVYGTLVVMATITVGYASQSHPWKLALIVSSTALVLWVAHLYAHGLSESIVERRRLKRWELVAIARREVGILLAAAIPCLALLVGAAGVMRETGAVWLAMGVGLVTLAVEGVRYAQLEGFGRTGTLLAVGANLALGSSVVLLKVLVAH